MSDRAKRVFDALDVDVDVLLVKNNGESCVDDTFFYLTEVQQGLFEGCSLLVFPDGSIDVLVSSLEAESAKDIQAHVHVFSSPEEHDAKLKQLISSKSKIGIQYRRFVYHDIQKIQNLLQPTDLIDTSQAFQKTRLIKDAQELKAIKQACQIVDTVAQNIPSFIKSDIAEHELAAEIDYHMQKYGAHHPAFTTISSFGPHTAEPHYTHDMTTLQDNQFVLCDFGATYQRYNSDITRTLFYGNPSAEERSMYELVRQAQQHAFDMIQPGVSASEIHKKVVEFIDSTQWKGRFIHSLGHSLGMAVHDGPGFSSTSSVILEEGMVLTVEPGVYVPGHGGVRIEDDICVTSSGFELLTKASKEFHVLN